MPAKKRPTAVQTRQGHTEGISDILGTAGKVAKYAVKGANYINPVNPKGLQKDIRNTLFAGKEIERVATGKGSKKDAAIIAGTAASWLVPFGKLAQVSKVVKVGKGVTRTSKVATKAARGAAKTASAATAWGGADYAANKATLATLNKVKPNKKSTVTAKSKSKKGK